MKEVPFDDTSSFTLDAQRGVVTFEPARRKVALVGHASTNVHAPYGDPEWEIWSVNAPPRFFTEPPLKVAHRWFQIHPLDVLDAGERAWLYRCPCPIYTIEVVPNVPTSVRYPLEAVLDMPGMRDFFACSFAYQIALALLEGFQEIGLYGVELPLGTYRERSVEAASVAWWCGFAEGRGVKITIPEESSLLFYPYRYGFAYWSEIDYVLSLGRPAPDEPLPPRPGGTLPQAQDAPEQRRRSRLWCWLRGYHEEARAILQGPVVNDDRGQYRWTAFRCVRCHTVYFGRSFA